jgi:hypothetical protein
VVAGEGHLHDLSWDDLAGLHHRLVGDRTDGEDPGLPPENFRGGVSPMRGAMPDHTGVPDKMAANIHGELQERGLENDPSAST